MTNIGDILGGAGSLISGIGSAYKAVITGQAQSGLFDAQVKALNTNTDITLKTIELSKKADEENRIMCLIQNKIRQDQYITEEEYDFIAERSIVNFSYDQYIDRITQQIQTDSVLKESSQELSSDIETSKVTDTSNINKYLILGGFGLIGLLIYLRRK